MNKYKLCVSIVCIVIAIIVFKVTNRSDYDTKGKMILLQCEKCKHVVEIEADHYEKEMKKLTEGLNSMEIMSHPHLWLDCDKCGGRLRIAIKNTQTKEIEIIGMIN